MDNVLHVEYENTQLDIYFNEGYSYLDQTRLDTDFTDPCQIPAFLDEAFLNLAKVIEIAQLDTIDTLIKRGYRLWSFTRALGSKRTWRINSNIMFKDAFVAEVFYALFYLGEKTVLELCQ